MSNLVGVSKEDFNRIVLTNASISEFWTSKPVWGRTVARVLLADEVMVWSDAGLFKIAALQSGVAAHLDGSATLGDLAEDLAACGGDIEWARCIVAALAVELRLLLAVEGVELAEVSTSKIEGEEMGIGDSVTAVANSDNARRPGVEPLIEVGPEGQRVVTEILSDGRRRVTTTMDLGAAHKVQPGGTLEAILGSRSPAELAPPDSCVGFKLRIEEDVPLLSVRCRDGMVRSVRCQDHEVAAALIELGGRAVVTSGERGPVVAFVVTPLEGCGPDRIYDGAGRRRGRPRSPTEAARVVDELLGEQSAEAMEVASDGPISVNLVFAYNPDHAVLLPTHLLRERGTARRLELSGFCVSWVRAQLTAEGSLTIPAEFGHRPVVAAGGATIVTAADEPSPPSDLVHLLHGRAKVPPRFRQPILERLCHFAQSVSVAELDLILTPS